MFLRRSIAAFAACGLIAAVLAGCGSSAGGPLQTELSYLPPGSPLVLTVATDPNSAAVKNTMSFIGRFPFAPALESALITRLKQSGVDYDADIKPLFGNPVALAITAASLSGRTGAQSFVLVWVTKSSSGLNSLVQRTSSGLHKIGTHQGATLYAAGGTAIAVDGSTLVLGPTASSVVSALDRHANGGGISQDEYSRSTTGLPTDAFVYAFGNLARVLAANPRNAAAERIPWVAAVRRYGVSIALAQSGVAVHYHVDTSGSSLTDAQLPIAPGTSPPGLPTGFPIAAGLRDPQHVVAFVQTARLATGPTKQSASRRREARLLAKTGANFTMLIRQLSGELVVGSDLKATMARSGVRNTAAAQLILARIAKDPGDAFPGSTVTSGGGFYTFHKLNGTTETFGVASGKLLVGIKVLPSQLRGFATAPTAPAPNAQGSVAFSVALSQLITLASRGASAQIPPAILKSLGDLTGWVSATTSGLDGNAQVVLK